MRAVAVILVILQLGGCAADGRLIVSEPVSGLAALEDPAGVAAPAAGSRTCETVASHSTTVGEDFTRSLADEAVVYRIAETRGGLMQKGLRRVKVAERRTTCEKHLYLGPGLQEYHCVAEARICGG